MRESGTPTVHQNTINTETVCCHNIHWENVSTNRQIDRVWERVYVWEWRMIQSPFGVILMNEIGTFLRPFLRPYLWTIFGFGVYPQSIMAINRRHWPLPFLPPFYRDLTLLLLDLWWSPNMLMPNRMPIQRFLPISIPQYLLKYRFTVNQLPHSRWMGNQSECMWKRAILRKMGLQYIHREK